MSTLSQINSRLGQIPTAVCAWDLKRIRRYLVEKKHFDPMLAKRLEEEYKKFITIRLIYPDAAIVPSKLIDEIWHTHILFTKDYIDFCNAVNNGSYIHHTPFLDGDEPIGAPSIQKTLILYQEMFGLPDYSIWPLETRNDCSADCKASCGACSSSDCGPRCT